jgi:Zn-dependent membrane protease YugP
MIPPLLLMLYAQYRVNSAYNKYSKVANANALTGAEAARRLLAGQGVANVRVEVGKGVLSDHYDPGAKVLRLSPDVANKASVAALGIAAHEVGHAVQHARGYAPLQIRNGIFPLANIGSQLGFLAVLAGLMLYYLGSELGLTVAWVGIALFGIAALFALVTLPVEFNASSRAKAMLAQSGMVSAGEQDAVARVLSAAALTYVASLVQIVMQLLYFIMLVSGARRRD